MAEDTVLNYSPLPTLRQFHESPARFRCIVGPVGSGKTTAAAWELCYYIPLQMAKHHDVKKTRWLILRNTYPELIDTTQKTVFDWFSWGDYKIQRKEYLLTYPSKGIEVEILFRSCDNPKDVRHFKSLELTGYWIDESIEVGEDVKLMLANRIGRYPRKSPRSYGIQTTNPPDIEDPTYFQFKWATPIPGPIPETKPLAEHTGFWQPPNENNANLPEGYYKKLIEAYANNLDWADRYVRGMPGITIRGKSVYNNFRRDLHVAKEPLQYTGGPLFAGWDNTGNCPACVIGYMPTAGLLHILREYHTERMGIVDFTHYVVADRNNRWPNAEWTEWGDPAGEAKFSKSGGGLTSNADLMREEANISLLKSEQNWEARRESVEFQLGRLVAGEPAILIDPSCHRLINGFIGGYCYPEVGTTGMFRETPEKNKFSHIHDALQYMCVMLFRNVRYRGRGKSTTTFEFKNLRHRSSTPDVGYKEIYA